MIKLTENLRKFLKARFNKDFPEIKITFSIAKVKTEDNTRYYDVTIHKNPFRLKQKVLNVSRVIEEQKYFSEIREKYQSEDVKIRNIVLEPVS